MFIAEFALEPFRLVLFVLVSFEICSTRAFMTTNIARKDLLLQMYIGDVLVSDRSRGKPF